MSVGRFDGAEGGASAVLLCSASYLLPLIQAAATPTRALIRPRGIKSPTAAAAAVASPTSLRILQAGRIQP